MSRPQKVHKPIKGAFDSILTAVASGTGKGRRAAKKLAAVRAKPPEEYVVNEVQRKKP